MLVPESIYLTVSRRQTCLPRISSLFTSVHHQSFFKSFLICIHHNASALALSQARSPSLQRTLQSRSILNISDLTSSFWTMHFSFYSRALKSFTFAQSLSAYCTARKWRQLRMEHGSGQRFDHTSLCRSARRKLLYLQLNEERLLSCSGFD